MESKEAQGLQIGLGLRLGAVMVVQKLFEGLLTMSAIPISSYSQDQFVHGE